MVKQYTKYRMGEVEGGWARKHMLNYSSNEFSPSHLLGGKERRQPSENFLGEDMGKKRKKKNYVRFHTDPMLLSETDRVPDKSMFVLLDFHDLLCLKLWSAVTVDDANTSTQLQNNKFSLKH